MGRDELLASAEACCVHTPEEADVWRLAQFWALVELGWNKALDASDHPDPAKRDVERADLAFWVSRGRAALEAGLLG